jgi:Rnl2 family RNA ligase
VHGANFSMVTNGQEVKYGKRTSFLSQPFNFFGCEKLVPEYDQKMMKLYEYIRQNVDAVTAAGNQKFDFSEIENVRVFGELYGGLYPHKEVKVIKDVKHVQKGVWYTPDLCFYGFDLMVGSQFLSCAKTLEIFEACDIPHGKPVVRGTLAEVIEFDVETFETTIPASFGLPTLDENISEGLVIREWDSLERTLIKKKADKFREKTGERPNKKRQKDMDSEVKELKSELETYFNINRLDNVLSKEDTPRTMKQL